MPSYAFLKPHAEKSLAELRDERERWDRLASSAHAWGEAQERAIELRAVCDTWIARRLREAQQRAA